MKSSFIAMITALLLSACGVPSNTRRPAAVTPSPTPAATISPESEPPSTPRPDEAHSETEGKFEGTAGVTDKESRHPGVAVLSAVRAGAHDSFDRIVFEFSESGLPGFHVEYVDEPVRSCGSGEIVPLAGDAWLEIRMTPAAAHTHQGKPTINRSAFSPNLPIVRDLRSTCDFEADVTWVAGVVSPNKYRVLELQDPARLVIDISH